MNRSARIIFGVFVLFAVVSLYHKVHSNPSPPPNEVKHETAAPAKNASPAATAVTAQPAPAATAQTVPSAKPASPAKGAQASGSPSATQGGLVAVIDPATGQLREADATDIGGLVAPQPVLQRRALTLAAPAAPQVATFSAPGGATGAVLGDDQMAFMVVTKTPDGKLSTDCVDGKKAADAKVRAGNRAKKKTQQEAKTQPAQKETTDEM